MKRLYHMIGVLTVFLLPGLAYSSMIVFDPLALVETAATAANTLNQLNEIKSQLEVMQQQKTMMEQQRLTLGGSQYQWSNAQRLIDQLGGIAQKNNALAYSAQNADAQFKQNFPGYQAPDNYSQQYRKITTTTLNTLNNVLQSIGTNANTFQDDNRRLAFLQQQEQSADNQLRAIQAASQIASEQVSQTQLLRQTIIAQTNAQTAFYASQVQNEASSRAELEKVINNGTKKAPAIGHSGNYITIPDYTR